MGNRITTLEQGMVEALEGFEMPVRGDWEGFSSNLPNKGKSISTNFLAAAVTTILFGSATVWYLFPDNQINLLSSHEPEMLSTAVDKLPVDLFVVQDFEPNETQGLDAPVSNHSNANGGNGSNSGGDSSPINAGNENPTLLAEEKEDRPVNPYNTKAKVEKAAVIAKEAKATEKPEDLKTLAITSEKTACVGENVSFELVNYESNKILNPSWDFGDGTFEFAPTAERKFTKPGIYVVTLSYQTKDAKISNSKEFETTIEILPKPKADFDWKFVDELSELGQVRFNNLSKHAKTSAWSFDDGLNSTEINPENLYKEKGEHSVTLTVTNEYKCADTKVKYVTIDKDYKLVREGENVLSSSEDNMYFMPEALKRNDVTFEMSIYDANKDLIFSSDNPLKPWNGQLKDGTFAPVNSEYTFSIAVTNESNLSVPHYGKIFINP